MRSRSFLKAALAVMCSVLLVSACGTSGADNEAAVLVSGDPVSGGVGRVIQVREPNSLDPASMSNNWVGQAFLGNALYGTLLIDNAETFDVESMMASSFETVDGGRTFTLTLRPNLKFSDGSALDAAAVKFNWDRLRDPATKSSSITQAAQVASTEVVDATTMKVTMVTPVPMFALTLIPSALNWIASPDALAKGQDEFNNAPVGAGPFTLTRWARQDVMELERNPGYWDAPKPYLDRVTLRTVPDANQRQNLVTTGSVNLTSEASWSTLARVEAAGFATSTVETGGGQFLAMNTRRAPFDDVRARKAVALAVDLDAMNTAVFEGEGEVPTTLFAASSPFFADIPLNKHDPVEAQRLFDELAAEGKPVEFVFTATTLVEIKAVAETLQAQLSAFDNVKVDVEAMDITSVSTRTTARDFDMLVSSANIQDPDSTVWNAFHKDSRGNSTGINDAQLSGALDAGRTSESQEDRKAAYDIVQQRISDLTPGIWYIKSAPSIVVGKNTFIPRMYALGSPLPEEMWIAK